MTMNIDRFSGEYVENRKEIHNRVRAEAGNRCIRCFHPEGDTPSVRMACDDRCTHPRDGKMRILTVHHLNGKKDDNRWWNLLALCQSCHLTIQGRVIPERPWLFEHSPWFIPFVCGFYASYYGGVDITREEADANPNKYLAMGQPWLDPEHEHKCDRPEDGINHTVCRCRCGATAINTMNEAEWTRHGRDTIGNMPLDEVPDAGS